MGHWNIDESRHARESLHPADYYSSSYYQIWIKALEVLLERHGFVSAQELAEGRKLENGAPAKRKLVASEVPAVLARGGPCDRPVETPPRFKAGDRVRTKNFSPTGHTCLPRYARAKIGMIDAVREGFVFPDTNAHGRGEHPQRVYTVVFDGTGDLGRGGRTPRSPSPSTLGKAILSRPDRSSLTKPVDEPVFAEPWQAQAFALVVALAERGTFSWSEWADTLLAEVHRPDAAADGHDYYEHWPHALEKASGRERCDFGRRHRATGRCMAAGRTRHPAWQADRTEERSRAP